MYNKCLEIQRIIHTQRQNKFMWFGKSPMYTGSEKTLF